MSTQKITYNVGTTDSPFNNLDQLIEEEQALPPIPNFPSIWKTSQEFEELKGTIKIDTDTD